MPDLPEGLVREVRRTIGDLRRVQLAAMAWPAVAGDLARLAAAVARRDPRSNWLHRLIYLYKPILFYQ
jgi:hypothetical protein